MYLMHIEYVIFFKCFWPLVVGSRTFPVGDKKGGTKFIAHNKFIVCIEAGV